MRHYAKSFTNVLHITVNTTFESYCTGEETRLREGYAEATGQYSNLGAASANLPPRTPDGLSRTKALKPVTLPLLPGTKHLSVPVPRQWGSRGEGPGPQQVQAAPQTFHTHYSSEQP